VTELEKETIVACVGAAFTGIPAILLFWWTWRRDQERLIVQKIIDYVKTLDGKRVVFKDSTGLPSLGILVRNRSLFAVRISAAGFRVDKEVLELENLNLPLRLKRNPDPSSNRLNIPDDSDPAEIKSGESLQIRLSNQSDEAAISEAIKNACQRRNLSAEELVMSRRVTALVALESGRIFSSLPFFKRMYRVLIEPLVSAKTRILARVLRRATAPQQDCR
jgi:hypothetical protein